jgi:hypothetical protein
MKPFTRIELEALRVAVEDWVNDEVAIEAYGEDDVELSVPHVDGDVVILRLLASIREVGFEIVRAEP